MYLSSSTEIFTMNSRSSRRFEVGGWHDAIAEQSKPEPAIVGLDLSRGFATMLGDMEAQRGDGPVSSARPGAHDAESAEEEAAVLPASQ